MIKLTVVYRGTALHLGGNRDRKVNQRLHMTRLVSITSDVNVADKSEPARQSLVLFAQG